jgi:hypothetical protein
MGSRSVHPRLFERLCSSADPPIRALRTASDLEDDDQVGSIVDQEDDPKIADAHAPEVSASQLDSTRRSWRESQCKDRTPKASGVARWKASELTLGGWRELDPIFALAHAPSGP